MNVILDTETQLGGNEISPRGYSKPCSGYGYCDQLSRTCQCPINRSVYCTVLLWFCWQKLLNFTATNKSAAQFSGLWHINNLDGLFFIIKKPAEYFLTIGSNFLVIGKIVSWYQNFTCISFLGVWIDDDQHGYVSTTVQHSIGKDRSLVFFLFLKFSPDTPIYFKGISVSKVLSDEIRYMINLEIEIIVRLQGRYLNEPMVIAFTGSKWFWVFKYLYPEISQFYFWNQTLKFIGKNYVAGFLMDSVNIE